MFGIRLGIVGVTWLALAVIAAQASPALASALAVVALGLSARMAWRARRTADWQSEGARLRRQVAAAAVLMAAGFLSVTFWSLGPAVTPWLIGLEAGALVHYWLLAAAGV